MAKRGANWPAMATSQTEVEAIDLAKEFGGFDGLYHVAGGSGRQMGDGPLHEVTDEGCVTPN